jgi:hypothetical protein
MFNKLKNFLYRLIRPEVCVMGCVIFKEGKCKSIPYKLEPSHGNNKDKNK